MRFVRSLPWLAMVGIGCGAFSSAETPVAPPLDGNDAAVTDAAVTDAPAAPDAPTVHVDDGGAADASLPLATDLVAYWKLDETSGTKAIDSAGGHDGTVTNGAWAVGQIGGAYATNGNGYITIPYQPSLAVGTSFTFAAWIWLDNTDHDSWIFMHGYMFFVKLNGRYPQLTMGSAYYNVYPTLPAKEWHHLAVVLDANVPKIYLDGKLGEARENTFGPLTSLGQAGSVIIGADNSGTHNSVGLIDDVRLWKRALSAAEVAAVAAGAK